jgi:hypothetical protein
MDIQRICSVDGCDKPWSCRGYCAAHYAQKLYRGEIIAVATRPGSRMQFIKDAVSSATDDCLEWPYGKSDTGYGGAILYDGRKVSPHRLVCELAHGRPIEGLQACHSCGNKACVNPRHLRFGTQSDNEKDKIAHGRKLMGEDHPWTRVTADMVIEIRSSPESAAVIGKRLGLGRGYIKDIRTGRSWGHVAGAHRRKPGRISARS